jgi:hypothetical protein
MRVSGLGMRVVTILMRRYQTHDYLVTAGSLMFECLEVVVFDFVLVYVHRSFVCVGWY